MQRGCAVAMKKITYSITSRCRIPVLLPKPGFDSPQTEARSKTTFDSCINPTLHQYKPHRQVRERHVPVSYILRRQTLTSRAQSATRLHPSSAIKCISIKANFLGDTPAHVATSQTSGTPICVSSIPADTRRHAASVTRTLESPTARDTLRNIRNASGTVAGLLRCNSQCHFANIRIRFLVDMETRCRFEGKDTRWEPTR